MEERRDRKGHGISAAAGEVPEVDTVMFSVGDNLKILFMVSRPDCATVRTTRRLIELNTEFQPSQPSYSV